MNLTGSLSRKVDLQTANVMFVYDRIIKDPDPFILHKIGTTMYDKFKEYIYMLLPGTMTMDAMVPYLLTREKENILEWLAHKEFDYQKNYEFLHGKFKDMYNESKPLLMATALAKFLGNYTIKNCYVWNPVDDIRQRYDLVKMYGDLPVRYVTGPYEKALRQCNINIVYDWSLERAKALIDTDTFSDVFFAIANYGFNFDLETGMLKYEMFRHKNIAHFNVVELNEKSLRKG